MSLSKHQPKAGRNQSQRKPDYRAVMGCYVEVDGEDSLYGLTCYHVTSMAANAVLYIEDKCKKLLRFGEVLERQGQRRSRSDDGNPHEDVINAECLKPPDINIFKITSETNKLCRPVYRNSSGKTVAGRLYKGNTKDLYGKTVFLYHIDGTKDDPLIKSIKGVVASPEKHTSFDGTIDLSSEFIVYGEAGQFATRGDSGRMVAMEVGDNLIEVIGIILSGDYRSVGVEAASDEHLCICLMLEKGLGYLSREYGKQFKLGVSKEHTLELTPNIEPGQMILYYRPQYSKPQNFDIVKQLSIMVDCIDLTVKGETALDKIIKFEVDLNSKVYKREDLGWKELEYPTADQTCIHKALLACENVYSGDLDKAMKCLREAYAMITANSCFRLRLLCRVFCYGVWLMLEVDDLEKAGTILDIAIPFMEGNTADASLPLDCLAYLYYDHSRYMQKLSRAENTARAKDRALQAIGVFEDDYRVNKGSTEGLALAYANYAHLLLGCGENFDTVNQNVNDTQMNEAELFLNKADRIKGNFSVEEIYILNAWGELHFRKGDIGKAMACFEQGMGMAVTMHLTKEKDLCDKRLGVVRGRL